MVNLDYCSRVCFKAGLITKYSTRKDHVMILAQGAMAGTKLCCVDDLTNHILSKGYTAADVPYLSKPVANPQATLATGPLVTMEVDPIPVQPSFQPTSVTCFLLAVDQ